MKFIHTSDWHIGRQFHNVSLLDDQAHVLKQVIQHLRDEDADALIIAGDIYDRSVPPAAAVALLDDVFQRIGIELNMPIILIPGNHDSAERLGFAAKQLRETGLYILSDLDKSDKAVVLTGKSGISVNFYGIAYNDPEQTRHAFDDDSIKTHNQAHTFLCQRISNNPAFDTNANNVLISHCFVNGAQACESERPLSIGGADNVDYAPMQVFDYVALGHLHSPQFKGDEKIRYSGSLLKYSFSEVKQKKSITCIEVDQQGVFTHRLLPLTPKHDMRILEGELDDLLLANDKNPNDYLLIRLSDKHAILDAMGKLRAVYPNVLHLEKIGLQHNSELQTLKREHHKRSELAMFNDFFQQTMGTKLSEKQQAALRTTIASLQEVKPSL